jgi:hypothetical protein
MNIDKIVKTDVKKLSKKLITKFFVYNKISFGKLKTLLSNEIIEIEGKCLYS